MDINKILITDEAKQAFIAGLIRIAKADGTIDEREAVFFQQAAYSLGLDDAAVKQIDKLRQSNEKIEIGLKNNVEKNFFLIQAVQLCLIDETYSEAEQKELRDICVEMGVSYNTLVEIEKWAYEGIAWNKRGEELLKLN